MPDLRSLMRPASAAALAVVLLAVLAASSAQRSGANTADSADSAGVACAPAVPSDTLKSDPRIVVDQFGYLPDAAKVAVIRDPRAGFDVDEPWTPGTTYAVVDVRTGEAVFEGAPQPWRDGAVDEQSGDVAYAFDFTSVSRDGSYVLLDRRNDVKSPEFRIADDVYDDVLRAAVRTFYFQRAGIAKEVAYTGEGWSDAASHVGPRQDREARRYDATADPATQRDLSGGWYDAGDYNRYTSWAAAAVVTLLRSYAESPGAFGDDYDIPESGNGIPDIVDEAVWGLEWLTRMQNEDGSVLSILGVDQASPPSAAKGPSTYGLASTSATLSAASAFAYASVVLKSVGAPTVVQLSEALRERAESAWSWAQQNPTVQFRNNDPAAGTQGLGAGQQEMDDTALASVRLAAAVYLFDATGKGEYRDFVDAESANTALVRDAYADPFFPERSDALLHYASLPGATAQVSESIRSQYARAMTSHGDPAAIASRDPYRAPIPAYTWGSNRTKANFGALYTNTAAVDRAGSTSMEDSSTEAAAGAEDRFATSASGRGLVDQYGDPWFGVGDAGWSLVGQLTTAQITAYLEDRAARGFRLVMFSAPEWYYADNAPNNANGDAAFTGTAFASPLNDAYWQVVDHAIDEAARLGITVLMSPAYLGVTTDGVKADLAAATSTNVYDYGVALGNRYKDKANLMWLAGHDTIPTATEQDRYLNLQNGVKAAGDSHLWVAGGWNSGGFSQGTTDWSGSGLTFDVETNYDYSFQPVSTTKAAWDNGTLPVIMVEGSYEGGRTGGAGTTFPGELRYQAWGSFVAGAMMHIFGNDPVWHFGNLGGDWAAALASGGAQDMTVLADLLAGREWSDTEPDTADVFLTSGEGAGTTQAGARFGGSHAVVYMPTARQVTLDLTQLVGSAFTITRIDPSTGTASVLASAATGSGHVISDQGRNADGDTDWALLVEAAGAPPGPGDLSAGADGYLHYLHGVNPLGLVYLSNMGAVGAERSVSEIYHHWFADGSADWDRVGESAYGPPPGFLTGGANPEYSVDSCCPGSCGAEGNATCAEAAQAPPLGQPPAKSYRDFNTGWPANSWELTENSIANQAAYIRLLSKYVSR